MRRWKIIAILPTIILLFGCGSKPFEPDQFLSQLKAGGFVQLEALDELNGYEERTDSEGKPFCYWGKMYPDDSIIQLHATAEEGKLVDYGYRMIDYGDIGLGQEPKNLTREEERDIVIRFISAFRPDLAKLEWTCEFQEPKHFWAWVANDGEQEYGVMVNEFGEVWRFSLEINAILV